MKQLARLKRYLSCCLLLTIICCLDYMMYENTSSFVWAIFRDIAALSYERYLSFETLHFAFALCACDVSVVELVALECFALDFNRLFLFSLLASAFGL